MAKLYGLAGELVRLLKTDAEIDEHGDPPQFDDSLEFDPATNAGVVEGLDTDWNAHRLSAGVLERDGQVVTINDPGEDYLADQQADDARNNVLPLLAGLRHLPAEDASYALLGRCFAIWDEAGQVAIDAIVDKGTAASYITGKAEWAALDAAQRQWAQDELGALTVFMQALIGVLT